MAEPDILVVEDDADIMWSLTQRLSAAGYHTIPAPDGDSALAVSQQNHLDAAIVDINLPVKNGFEVAEQLLAQGIKTILITASRDQAYRQKAKRLGCHGFVEKPFTRPYLLSLLADLLEGDAAKNVAPKEAS
ncbi:MAG: response regulator [Pseudomonadales bacterium]